MKQSANGFTLVEMLLSLMIFLLIISSIPLFLKVVLIWTTSDNHFNEYEWQVFIQQTKMEIKECSELTVSNDMVSFTKNNGQVVTYESYQDKIRRRVNGQGHEIILQNVNSVHYRPRNNGFSVIYKDKSNQQHAVRISAISEILVLNDE